MNGANEATFVVRKPEASTPFRMESPATFEEMIRVKFAAWSEDFYDPDPMQAFPLRSLAPDVARFLAEAGHLTQRDMRYLVEEYRLDVNPHDAEAFYDALLDIIEPHPWILPIIETDVANHRAGRKPGKRVARQSRSKFFSTVGKLLVAKMGLFARPDLQERLGEFVSEGPVATEMWVAAFCEYVLFHYTHALAEEDDRVDLTYTLVTGKRNVRARLDDAMEEAEESGDWTKAAILCEKWVTTCKELGIRVPDELLEVMTEVISGYSWNLVPRNPERYWRLAGLATVAAEIAETRVNSRAENFAARLDSLDVGIEADDLTVERLDYLTSPQVESLFSQLEAARAAKPELTAKAREIEEKITAASKARDFNAVRNLADEAEKIDDEVKAEKTLAGTLNDVVTALLEDDFETVREILGIEQDETPEPEESNDADPVEARNPPAESPVGAVEETEEVVDDVVPGLGIEETPVLEENSDDASPVLDDTRATLAEDSDDVSVTSTPTAPVEVIDASNQVDATPSGTEASMPEDREEDIDETPEAEGDLETVSGEPSGPDGQDEVEEDLPEQESIDPAVLGDLLSRGLVGIAAETAEALEENGESWPIRAAALRAAAGSRARLAGYGPDSQDFFTVANRAVNATGSDLGSCLLLGALLRPVVSQQGFADLRPGMPDLARGALGPHLIDVANAVSELSYDFPPDPDVLAGISGEQQVPKKERIARKIEEWSQEMGRKSSRWPFATAFLKSVISESGAIGRARAAIKAGSRDAVLLARAAIDELDSAAAIETRAEEFGAANGRHLAKLHPKGIDYLQRHFNEGFALLEEWITVSESEKSRGDRSEDRIRSTVGRLSSRLDKARENLRAHVTADAFEASVAGWIAARIDEAITALQGKDAGDFGTVENALTEERDLLSLPSDFIERDPGEKLAWLVDMFASGGVPAPQDAFERALDRGAFETAQRLSMRFDLGGDERIALMHAKFVETWRERILDCEQNIKTIRKVDYAHQEEIAHWLDWFQEAEKRLTVEDVDAEIQDLDDIPDQVAVFSRVAAEIEAKIRRDQEDRIRTYRSERNAEDADALLGAQGELTLEAIEDRIAQLRDDRSAATVEADLEGLVSIFTPDWVRAASSADWPRSIQDYKRALAQDGPLHTEEDRRAAALDFIGLYREIGAGIPKGPPAKAKVQGFFEEIGFDRVTLSGANSVDRSRAWQMNMTAELKADDFFLPPTFGSKARDGYSVFLVGQDVLPEAIVKAIAPETPVILVLAGIADLSRRHEFAARLRAAAIPALLVDEALVAFAAVRRETRARTIFECGLPYGRVEPYTTDAGQIPPEMFFGRIEDIRTIMSRTANGCLVYGGRQLGKSALLSHVAKIYHDPAANRIVLRRDVKALGKAEPASNIWSHLKSMLARDRVVKPTSTQPDEVIRDISNWIETHSNAQVLCMFDEADNFLAADTLNDYQELSRLKEFMEDSERSFKVVFAGLHNVQRMFRQPNSPLAHLGTPICIGPLNQTEDDKRAAHELVILPMRAAGFRFESTEAVEDILAWANYYPSLVQEFAKGLISMLHGAGSGQSYRLSEDGPLWTIPTSELFEHRGFRAIEERIREKFHWTLDLDPRYALVAYTLAGLAADGHTEKALKTGFRASELLEYAMISWPRTAERPSAAAFDAILEEMFDLGVLGRVPIPDTKRHGYLLRTQQVAAMLGSHEDIDHALRDLEAKDPPVSYDRTTYRRRYAPGERSIITTDRDLPYSPLTDFQIERLLEDEDDRRDVRIVCGLESLGLSKVGPSLKWISENGQLPGGAKGGKGGVEVVIVTGQKELGNAVSKPVRPEGLRRIVIYKPVNAIVASDVISRLEQKHPVLDGKVIPVLILDAMDPNMRDLAVRRGEQSEFLSAWGAEMVRIHLTNIERTDIDSATMRERILSVTGGIPTEIVKLVTTLVKARDMEAVFSTWSPVLRASGGVLDGPLGQVLPHLEDVDDPEDYAALDDLLREETGADLVTHGPDLVATGLLADWSASAQRIRLSAFGKLLCRTDES